MLARACSDRQQLGSWERLVWRIGQELVPASRSHERSRVLLEHHQLRPEGRKLSALKKRDRTGHARGHFRRLPGGCPAASGSHDCPPCGLHSPALPEECGGPGCLVQLRDLRSLSASLSVGFFLCKVGVRRLLCWGGCTEQTRSHVRSGYPSAGPEPVESEHATPSSRPGARILRGSTGLCQLLLCCQSSVTRWRGAHGGVTESPRWVLRPGHTTKPGPGPAHCSPAFQNPLP